MVIPAIAKFKVEKALGPSVVAKLLKTSTAAGAKSVAKLANTMTINFDIPFDWEDISISNIYRGKRHGE